ncbi:cell morphogenesis N-terminal-domain-containing protein [Crepidotus variabilis]|uniref:Cell morphogenesis N-terminal-domain-containing protein n=1 Tax=Crepidotus variabilis TaxID=179855 RepID=A0A9P6EAF2_9AGAR|nr:cell morphogenesis N-terminal-domain-containing protein [Crepidotus variabilis]
MSEGIQITIPDFDDDSGSSATPFGRAGLGFGSAGFGSSSGFGSSGFGSTTGFGGGFGSGLDSPGAVTTPLSSLQSNERSYFSHTRGDSNASIDSTGSATTRFASKPGTPFSHSAQPSLANASTGFSKKPSFASIRNAFKSSKNVEAPPMPPIDNTAYPVLKNPFGNRSTSSLSHIGMGKGGTTPTGASGMSFARPPTPGSTDTRAGRNALAKSKSHGYTRSQHSHSGSIFHVSDGGSDGNIPSPPPVPRVPSAYGKMFQDDTTAAQDLDEDKVVMDLKSPSDYALHAVFIRFASMGEEKIDSFLREPLDQDVLLSASIGPGVDSKFDETLQSLGIIAQKHAKQVIDSILRWRRTHIENVGSELIRLHISNRHLRPSDVPSLLNERKSLASIYIMCRALIAVLQMLSKDGLGDTLGFSLEETTFEQFRKPDRQLLTQGSNHRINSELYATLLGHLANVRFISVTDRFLAELGPVAQNTVSKDVGTKYENLVKGLRHIKIKVWPPEAFEEGAEFIESLSKSFANAHGVNLKLAFAETLVLLLHPIGKTAQAETNHPEWGKAIEVIFPKAREMMSKPRYWTSAYPLAVTSLCMAPQTYFLKHWQAFFESSVSKLKEKPSRTIALNGLIRLVWTYLYRCQESTASTAMTKLENLLKPFFPSNRTTPLGDDLLEPLTYILHFILSRHPEYGRDMCLELLQESAINNLQQKGGNLGTLISHERVAIVVNAVLLSAHNIEREVLTPSWPTSTDFNLMPSKDDYPSSSTYIPPTILKPGFQEFLSRCGSTLAHVTAHCGNSVGSMSVFEDQYSYAKLAIPYDESSSYTVRRHIDGPTVAYPNHAIPNIAVLNSAFQAWPRFLHPSIALPDVIDLLLRGVIHVEPSLAESAMAALERFMDDDVNALQVISRFNYFLFSPNRVCHDSGFKLHIEFPPLLGLWHVIIQDWIQAIIKRGIDTLDLPEQILSKCVEIEAAALFLLANVADNIRSIGIKVIKLLGSLDAHLITSNVMPRTPSFYITERLQSKHDGEVYWSGYEDLLDKSEMSRLEQWHKFQGDEVALRIVDSPNEKDKKLWRYIFPNFLQHCTKQSGGTVGLLREAIIASVSRYHPLISYLAGLSSRMPSGLVSRNPQERDNAKLVHENKHLVDQWHMWMKILSSTAIPPDSSRPALTSIGREHSRATSDVSFDRERYLTTRGLFRHLTPFLDSEYTQFRDAAALCISSFPANAYPHLLEDLSLLAGRQFYDDSRSKATTPSAEQSFGLATSRQIMDDTRARSGSSGLLADRNRRQERLHSAVARIYFITSHLLEEQRSSNRTAALSNILKFVRNTQAFLSTPEMRENSALHRLRRYFCGIVERLFGALANLKDSERFIPAQMHLTLYRLCEDWCQVGPMTPTAKDFEMKMKKTLDASESPDNRNATQRLRIESGKLSHASVGALTALSQRAFFPPDQAASSPTDAIPIDLMQPLSVSTILKRLSAVMNSSHSPNLTKGKAALRALLTHPEVNYELLHEVSRGAIIASENINTSSFHFFDVLSEVVCEGPHHFTFAQVACLGLTNLRHPSSKVRGLSFNILESIHQHHNGLLAMSTFESSIASMAPAIYVNAYRLIADFLAGEHPFQAVSMLAQLGNWLPQLPGEAFDTNTVILLLQSLEFWIPNINLMTDDRSELTREGTSCLYHLTALTLRFNQTHAEQVFVLWSKLVDSPYQSNGRAAVTFLLEQSHKVGSTLFVTCASNIVASLCQTHIGRQVFEDLCAVMLPTHMLPNVDHKLGLPPPDQQQLWEDLDLLFGGDQPRLALGSAQFAWLFLSDASLQRYWEMKDQLPTLLHLIFTHIDHRLPVIRHRAHSMLFQILRSWMPGYDELPDRSTTRLRSSVKQSISIFEKEAESLYWEEEDSGEKAIPKMKSLISRVVGFLEPLAPQLLIQWGSLALMWGTACSIRAIAFRSLQIFRALMPKVKKADFALLVGRLSSTIADPEDNIQAFTSEILSAIDAIAISDELDKTLVPQVFWCACACLSTTVEQEFGQVVKLLHSLVKRIDLDDPVTVDQLLCHRPIDWTDSPFIQPPLLKGLRSSTTSTSTMDLLKTLAKIQDDRLIDASGGRLRDLYVIVLPWCLHAMDTQDNTVKALAESISVLATNEKKLGIQRIMNSFSKGHFRTRDDFLRQSVSSLRDFAGQNWTQIVTHLLGLVLNEEQWLRVYSMQVLKILFQQREARNPVELFGSELLMPLLRLVETDLAAQALDVLDEPIVMSANGPAAKHVLRMSMHLSSIPNLSSTDPESATVVFGVPEKSGWSIAQVENIQDTCRANVLAVFDTCSVPMRPSRIDFEPEVEALASIKTPMADDLGGLVRNLHEINTFFTDDDSQHQPRKPSGASIPTRRLEARVAAILAKSTATDAYNDIPQTPFLDVFRVGMDDANDSDESSDTDSDTDAFVFDTLTSPTPLRTPLANGRYH